MFNRRIVCNEFWTFFRRKFFFHFHRLLSVLLTLSTSNRVRLIFLSLSETSRRPMLLLLRRCRSRNDVEKRFERFPRLLRRPVKRFSRQDDDDHRNLSTDFQNFQIRRFWVPELVNLTIQDPSGLREVFEPKTTKHI